MHQSVLSNELSEKFSKPNCKTKNEKLLQLISKNYMNVFLNEIDELGKNELLWNAEEKKRLEVYYRLKLGVDRICGMTDSYAKETYRILRGLY